LKKIRNRFISLLLCFSLVTSSIVQANAIPIAVFEGTLAIIAVVSVALGFQTADADDFKDLYRFMSPSARANFIKSSASLTLTLSRAAVDDLHNNLIRYVGGENKVTYKTKTYDESPVDDLDSDVQRLKFSKYSTSTVSLSNFVGRNELFKELVSSGLDFDNFGAYNGKAVLYSSTPVKIDGMYYRLLDLSCVNMCGMAIQRSHNGTMYETLKLEGAYRADCKPFAKDDGFYYLSFDSSKVPPNDLKYKLGFADGNLVIELLSADNRKQGYVKVCEKNYSPIVINNTAITDLLNTESPVNKLPVDRSKLYNTKIDATRSYNKFELEYNKDDIRVSSATGIDPITKGQSSGGTGTNTGGTTIDLSDVKANISNLTSAVNTNTAQVNGIAKTNYDFFGWLKAFLATMLTAIQSIPTSIVSALDGIKTAVLSIPTTIVNALESVRAAVLSIPSTIVKAIDGVISAIQTLATTISTGIVTGISGLFTGVTSAIGKIATDVLQGLKTLFIPNAVNYQASVMALQATLNTQLGLFKQAFEVLFRIVKQDYNYIKPKFVIKLDPPFGDGTEYEIISLKWYDDYRDMIMLVENAFVWFLFFRKVAMHNPFRGGGEN
jgi:hypothetical protein